MMENNHISMLNRYILLIIFVILFSSNIIAFSLMSELDGDLLYPFNTADIQQLFKEAQDYSMSGQRDKAISECKEIITNHPRDTDVLIFAYFTLGNFYMKAQSYEKADEAYHNALNIINSSGEAAKYKNFLPQLNVVRVQNYIAAEKFDKAIQISKEMIEELSLRKTFPKVFLQQFLRFLKESYIRNQQGDVIVPYFEELVVQHSKDEVAGYILLELAFYYKEQKEYKKALTMYEKIKREFPDNNFLIIKAQKGTEDINQKNPSLK